MSFGDLASVTGGGAQTPGFVGVGRLYLSSPKFLAADGGCEAIWCGCLSRSRKAFASDCRKKPSGSASPTCWTRSPLKRDAMTEEEVVAALGEGRSSCPYPLLAA